MNKLIEYEFSCSKRHRRFLTILLFTVLDQGEEPVYSALKAILEESDCYVQIGATFTILFSERDKDDVLGFLSRQFIEQECDSGYAYTLVGYPQDGTTLGILMEQMRERNLLQADIA